MIGTFTTTEQLRDAIRVRVDAGAEEVDVLNWMSRAGLEMIGQGGLGYSFDPLTADTKDDYGDALKSFKCVSILSC